MKSLEIFSGAGGLAEGLKLSGFKHSGLLEYDRDACNTLRANFSQEIVLEQDIRDLDFGQFTEIDLFGGGPPCQPFSIGGKARGQLDERDMFPYAINGIRELKPRAFIFENVKGLLRKSFEDYFKYIILQLTFPAITQKDRESWFDHLSRLERQNKYGNDSDLEYRVVHKLINAANYGVPQKRERVIIVGIRNDLDLNWSFPAETHSADSLTWDKFVTKEYWYRNEVPQHQQELPDALMKKRISNLKQQFGFFKPTTKPWMTVREAINDLPDPQSSLNVIPNHVFRDGARIYPGHTGSYIDEPSKTIKAGGHGVPGGENMIRYPNGDVRYFTICEAKRIQTFPDDYKITGSWSEGMRQLGNAVPVALSLVFGQELNKKLSYRESHNELGKFRGKTMFPEKLAKANEILKKVGLPEKRCTKNMRIDFLSSEI